MNTKRLHGKDGELIISYKNVVFANAERFTAELSERGVMNAAAKLGTYTVCTGYEATLRLDDVSITDNATSNAVISDLRNGEMPVLDFRGIFRRDDGLAEPIVFRSCIPAGEIDMIGLARGYVWELHLAVNGLTDDHIRQFTKHGE
jgi:hypothetical protein